MTAIHRVFIRITNNIYSIKSLYLAAQTNLPAAGAGCATVTVNARSPGETRLTATFNRLQAQIDITSTVDLTGIRIVTSTANAETGSLISAHIQGITKDGEFSFDDAIYPFDVYWKLSGSDVAVLKSPLAVGYFILRCLVFKAFLVLLPCIPLPLHLQSSIFKFRISSTSLQETASPSTSKV